MGRPLLLLSVAIAVTVVAMLAETSRAAASSSSAADILPSGYSTESPEFNHGALALELANAGFAHEAHNSFRAAAEFQNDNPQVSKILFAWTAVLRDGCSCSGKAAACTR